MKLGVKLRVKLRVKLGVKLLVKLCCSLQTTNLEPKVRQAKSSTFTILKSYFHHHFLLYFHHHFLLYFHHPKLLLRPFIGAGWF